MFQCWINTNSSVSPLTRADKEDISRFDVKPGLLSPIGELISL